MNTTQKETELTIEQSQRLIELGVGADKASKTISTTISEEEYNDRRHLVFTLNDLLNLLPKWIKHCHMLLWLNIWIDQYTEKWCTEYRDTRYDSDEADTFQSENNLVDCLYLLLAHLIESNYIKL